MVLRLKPEKVEERERTRKALLRATLQRASRHGFAGLGLREVARGADIAPTSFYRHFADIEELGLCLVREEVAPLLTDWLGRVRDKLEARAPVSDPARVLVTEAHATLQRDPDLMRFVLAERVGAVVSSRRAIRAELETWSEGLSRVLDTPRELTDAVLTLLLESLTIALDEDPPTHRGKTRVERQIARVLALPGSERS